MPIQDHEEGKKDSSQGNLESHKLDHKKNLERIESLEREVSLLKGNLASIRFQIKFLVGLIKKDLP